jgi:hypothetical protein
MGKSQFTLQDFEKFRSGSSEDFGPIAFAAWAGIKKKIEIVSTYEGLIRDMKKVDKDLHERMKDMMTIFHEDSKPVASKRSKAKGKEVATGARAKDSSTIAEVSTTHVLMFCRKGGCFVPRSQSFV